MTDKGPGVTAPGPYLIGHISDPVYIELYVVMSACPSFRSAAIVKAD